MSKKEILPVFLSCQGESLSDDEKRLFTEYNPLGVCLFSKCCANVRNKEQVFNLVTEIKQVLERDDVLIAVDQEGGRVRRLLDPEFTAVAAPQNLTSEELAREHAYLISADLHGCGINVNFAPVLDTMHETTSASLQGRCFSNNIAALGKAMVDEYIRQGICPCVKHLPGHGRAAADPHLNLPVIYDELSVMEEDFAPFRALNNAPMGMVAHVVVNAVDPDNAATVSAKVIERIVRGSIGFRGLLVSDAINMRALPGSIAEKAQRCIAAGCDVVCLGNVDFAANVELCRSGIRMSEAAEQRLSEVNKIIAGKGDFAQYEQVKNKYCEKLENIISYDYGYDATEVLNKLRQV